MWSVECFQDPVSDVAFSLSKGASSVHSAVVLGRVPIVEILTDSSQQTAFQQGGRVARVSLADYVARRIAKSSASTTLDSHKVTVELLDKYLASRSRRGKKKPSNGNTYAPFVIERSDVWCNETDLHVVVRVIVSQQNDPSGDEYMVDEKKTEASNAMEHLVKTAATDFLSININNDCCTDIMKHVACAVIQNKLRQELRANKHVAFVADGSILPRKSGASTMPMASPPAIPFAAPVGSPTRQSLTVDMGSLRDYLPSGAWQASETGTAVTFTGLVVPAGITLICGGGYHGKVRTARLIFMPE